MLNMKDPMNQWDVRNNKKLYWPDKNPVYFVIQFILNNIQSNIYQYQNSNKSGGAQSNSDQSQKVEPQV